MILVGVLYLLPILLFRYVRLSGHPTNLWHKHIFNTHQQHYHNNNSTVRETRDGYHSVGLSLSLSLSLTHSLSFSLSLSRTLYY